MWRGEIEPKEREDRTTAMEIWNSLPEENKGWLTVYVVLPYEHILDIDEQGDEYCGDPHIYTVPWRSEHGPFIDDTWFELKANGRRERRVEPDPENRVQKFPRKDNG